MDELKNKSGLFELAAKESNRYMIYISVPHNAYYSCLMFIRHIWIEKKGNSETSVGSAVSQMKGKTGSHEFLINQIATILVQEKIINRARDFLDIVGQLKDLRVEADYSAKIVDREKAENAIRIMEQILPLLKKCA